MVSIIALTGLSLGYAQWTETLEINPDGSGVNTGELDVTFDTAGEGPGVISNDDGNNLAKIWCDGPYCGMWLPDPDDDGSDPTEPQTLPLYDPNWPDYLDIVANPVDRTQDVASTTVSGGGTQTMTVTIENAYPSYWPTVFYTIRNWESIPAKVSSIKLVMVDVGESETPVDVDLEPCTQYFVDCDTGSVEESLFDDADLMLHISDDTGRLFAVMEPGGGYGVHGFYESAVCGNLDIHVLEGAEENTGYSFEIEFVASQATG